MQSDDADDHEIDIKALSSLKHCQHCSIVIKNLFLDNTRERERGDRERGDREESVLAIIK